MRGDGSPPISAYKVHLMTTAHTAHKSRDANPKVLLAVLVAATALLSWWGWNSAEKTTPSTAAAPAASASGTTPASSPDEDATLVTVNGEAIKMRDLKIVTMSLSPEERQQLESTEGQVRLMERMVQMKILEQEGRRLGLASDPDVRHRVETAGDMTLAEATLERLAREAGSGDPKSLYEKHKERFEAFDTNQILITTDKSSVPARKGKALAPAEAKQKADRIVAQLRAGGNFGQIAQAESDDPETSQRGGRTGPMPREALPNDLDAALVRLQPGQVSDPIETQFGYFIFQLIEKTARPFEEVKPLLERQGAMLQAQGVIKDLSAKAKVVTNPQFFGGAKPNPAAPVQQ